jgi:hypothetical protein
MNHLKFYETQEYSLPARGFIEISGKSGCPAHSSIVGRCSYCEVLSEKV